MCLFSIILPAPGLAHNGLARAPEYTAAENVRAALLDLLISHKTSAELTTAQRQALSHLIYEHLHVHPRPYAAASCNSCNPRWPAPLPKSSALSQLELIPCGLLSVTISLYSHGYAHLIEFDAVTSNILIGALGSIILALCTAS